MADSSFLAESDSATQRPFVSGTVYAVLLNHEREREALALVAAEPPYRGLPKAPVLAIRPANTLAGSTEPLRLPASAVSLDVVPALVAVIGTAACRVSVEAALSHVAGWGLAFDASLPLQGWHRPAVRQKCHDGFCKLMPSLRRAQDFQDDATTALLQDPQTILHTPQGEARLPPPRWHRHPAQVIADISEFMTLHPGDCLLLPLTGEPLSVHAGDSVRLQVPALGTWRIQLEVEQ